VRFKALVDHCTHIGIHISFEYSGPTTLQRNGKVKLKYHNMTESEPSFLNGAGLKDEVRSYSLGTIIGFLLVIVHVQFQNLLA
jgi:hypothetical protein